MKMSCLVYMVDFVLEFFEFHVSNRSVLTIFLAILDKIQRNENFFLAICPILTRFTSIIFGAIVYFA